MNIKNLTQEKQIIYNKLCFERSFYYIQILNNIIERIDDNCSNDLLTEEIMHCIDEELIYYTDQWSILQEFFTPNELNENSLNEAFELVYNDIFSILE